MEGNRTNSNTLHFGIYNHVLTVDGDKLVTRKLIVLKDERLPVAFTNFRHVCRRLRNSSEISGSATMDLSTYMYASFSIMCSLRNIPLRS